MYLQVDPHAGAERRLLVHDADDCTRLHVVGTAPDGTDLDDEAITAVFVELDAGMPANEPGHLRLDVTWLEERARASAINPGWQDRFVAMLRHSRERGWLDDSTGTVGVHVERRPVPDQEDHMEVTR